MALTGLKLAVAIIFDLERLQENCHDYIALPVLLAKSRTGL